MKLAMMLLVSAVALAMTESVAAETYIAGQGGINLNPRWTNVEGTGSDAGILSNDLKLKTSPMYGAKIGHFFESIPWLGIEADVYYSRPDVEQQTITRRSGIPGIVVVNSTANQPGSKQDVITAAGNLIARYPGKVFQPYIGGGAGLGYSRVRGVFLASSNSFANDSDIGVQFDGIAGVRVFLTRHLAAFGEYKYSRTSFQFDTIQIKTDYQAHIFAIGLGYHF